MVSEARKHADSRWATEKRELKKLTDTAVKNLKAPPGTRAVLSDLICPGLTLRTGKGGRKTWSVIYRVNGRGPDSPITGRPTQGPQRRLTLGDYPAISLDEARHMAREALHKSAQGIDPQDERDALFRERRDGTLEHVAERYLTQYVEKELKRPKVVRRVFEMHIYPAIGQRVFRELERADVVELIDQHIESGRIGVAREVRKHMSALMSWGCDKGLISANPMAGYREKKLAHAKDNGRCLTNDEIRWLWQAAGRLNYPYGPWFRLLLLTGHRRIEWANATWSEIDLPAKTFTLGPERTKQQRDHSIPLVGEALRIVECLPRHNGGDYVFSTLGGAEPISSFDHAKRRIDREMAKFAECDIPRWTIHDLRRTFRTHLDEALGIEEKIAEDLIGHKAKGIRATYNKSDYAEARITALIKYDLFVSEVVNG